MRVTVCEVSNVKYLMNGLFFLDGFRVLRIELEVEGGSESCGKVVERVRVR